MRSEKKEIIIIGGGGHAKSVIDSIETTGEFQIAGILDKKENLGKRLGDYQISGTDDDLQKFFEQGVTHAFIAIGYLGKSDIRSQIYTKVKQIGYVLPVICDATALVARDALIGPGTFVGKYCVVNAAAQVGEMCIINTASIIEHDCKIHDFSHIAVKAVLCGGVEVGSHSLVGAATVVKEGIKIGNYAIVGMGTTLLTDVKDYSVQYDVKYKNYDVIRRE